MSISAPPPIPADPADPSEPAPGAVDEVDLGSELKAELEGVIPNDEPPPVMGSALPAPVEAPVKPTYKHLETDPLGFSISQLPSGLTVLHLRTQKPAFRARIRMRAGHIHDPPRLEGTAHLTLHHLYSGTEGMAHTDQDGLQEWAKQNRVRLDEPKIGNYFTEFAGTCMTKHLQLFLDMMRSLIFKPVLGSNLDQARELVQEKRMERAITERSERLRRAIMQAHCDEHRIVTATGYPNDFTLFRNSIESVRDFHAKRYRMSNAMIAVATNVEHLELLGILEETFVQEGEDPSDEFKYMMVQPCIPVPTSLYAESGTWKKGTKMEIAFTWVISRNKMAVSALVREIVEKLLQAALKDTAKLSAGLEVAVNRGLEFDTFLIKVKTVLERNKVQLLKDFIIKAVGMGLGNAAEKELVSRHLKESKEAMEEELCIEDENATSALEQALSDWYLYQKILTPEARLKAFQDVTDLEILSFLREELKPEHCFCATVEQSE